MNGAQIKNIYSHATENGTSTILGPLVAGVINGACYSLLAKYSASSIGKKKNKKIKLEKTIILSVNKLNFLPGNPWKMLSED